MLLRRCNASNAAIAFDARCNAFNVLTFSGFSGFSGLSFMRSIRMLAASTACPSNSSDVATTKTALDRIVESTKFLSPAMRARAGRPLPSSGARIFCSWTRRHRSGSAVLKTYRSNARNYLISVIVVLSSTKRDACLRQRAPSGATPYCILYLPCGRTEAEGQVFQSCAIPKKVRSEVRWGHPYQHLTVRHNEAPSAPNVR